jgi:acetyl esterase/lipase
MEAANRVKQHKQGNTVTFADNDKETCIVYIHGGGWKSGNASEFKPYAYKFTSTADIYGVNYTEVPYTTVTGQIIEIVKCVKALKQNYKNIFLMGYSAGGHLAIMTANYVDVQGIITIAPPVDFTSIPQLESYPLAKLLLNRMVEPLYSSRTKAPILLIQGDKDTTVLPDGAKKFAEKHSNCKLLIVEGVHTLALINKCAETAKLFINANL